MKCSMATLTSLLYYRVFQVNTWKRNFLRFSIVLTALSIAQLCRNIFAYVIAISGKHESIKHSKTWITNALIIETVGQLKQTLLSPCLAHYDWLCLTQFYLITRAKILHENDKNEPILPDFLKGAPNLDPVNHFYTVLSADNNEENLQTCHGLRKPVSIHMKHIT